MSLGIKLFLEKVRKLIEDEKYEFLKGRSKNRETLIKLGLTVENAINIVFNLEERDCISGPNEELNSNEKEGIIYIFIKQLEDQEFPIKLYIKIKKVKEEDMIVIISFHETLG